MTTSKAPRRPPVDRFLEARALRVARRVEAVCQRRVPDCDAAVVMKGPGGSFDLSVGLRGGEPAERVWARGLDVLELDNGGAAERLARFLEVWIEPPATSAAVGQCRSRERPLAV